ncbi:hypothetical protein ABPG74_001470 [Tetrahymena malaccensis]
MSQKKNVQSHIEIPVFYTCNSLRLRPNQNNEKKLESWIRIVIKISNKNSGFYEIVSLILGIVEQKKVEIQQDLILLVLLVTMIVFSYFLKESNHNKFFKEALKLCQLIFYLEYSFQIAQNKNNYCFFCVFQILLMLYIKQIKQLQYIILLYFFIAFYIIARILILSNFLVESLYSLCASFALASISIRNEIFSHKQNVQNSKKNEEISQFKSFEQPQNLDLVKLKQASAQIQNLSLAQVNNSNYYDMENSYNLHLRKRQTHSLNNSIHYTKSRQPSLKNYKEKQFAQIILSQIRTGIALIDSQLQLVYTNRYLKQQMSTSNHATLLQKLLKVEIIQNQNNQEDCCQVSETWSKTHLNYNEPNQNNQEQLLQKQTLSSFKTNINTNSSHNKNSVQQQQQQNQGLESYNSIAEKRFNQIETLNNITDIQSRLIPNHNNKKHIYETKNKFTQQQISFLDNKTQLKYLSQSEKLIPNKQQRVTFQKYDQSLNKDQRKVEKQEFSFAQKSNDITYFYNEFKSTDEKRQTNDLKMALKNMHQLLIPPHILQIFKRDQLNLQDILEYLFQCQYKQDKQNCWSSDDLNEKKETNQIQQNQIIEAQQEQSSNVIYLIENNNLVLSFKQKWDKTNYKKIRIGFYATKKGFDAGELFTNGVVMIEVLEDYELSKTIEDHEINEYKNRMLASVSHELRTPLNCSIQLLQSLLQRDQEHLSMAFMDGETKEMIIKPALNSNLLLLNIINDILDYGQINQGKLELQFQPFSIVDAITECIDLIYFQANQKGLTIEVQFDVNLPEIVYSDQGRLKQVLLNLLSNSLKFTDAGTIRVNTIIENLDLIRIDVSDTGCGIPEDNLEKVLQAFGNKSNGKFLNTIGAGFGMSIANNLAHGLGGNRSIQIQSRVKEGSTFTFYVINRAKNKKGCQYKLKDVFNMKLVRWETLNRLDVQSTYLRSKKQKTKIPSELLNNKSDFDNPSPSQIDNQDIQTLSHKTNTFVITYRPKNDNLKQIPTRSFSIGQSIKSNQEIKTKTKQNSSTKYTKKRASFIDCFEQIQHINQQSQYQEQYYQQDQLSCPYLYKSEQKLQNVESCQILEEQQSDLAFMFASDIPKNSTKKYFRDYLFIGDETSISLSHRRSFDTVNDDTKYSQEQLESKNGSSVKTPKVVSLLNKAHSINNQKGVQFEKNNQTFSNKLIENTITNNLQNANILKQSISSQNSISSLSQDGKIVIKQINQIQSCNCSKILVVDDNDFNIYALQMCLKSYGFTSDKATSGFMAIDKIKQRLKQADCCLTYKLIFMDIDMPIKDGYETTKNILHYFKKKNKSPPKISACTAYVQEKEKKKAFDCGMSYYLTKPINNFELENILKIELNLKK